MWMRKRSNEWTREWMKVYFYYFHYWTRRKATNFAICTEWMNSKCWHGFLYSLKNPINSINIPVPRLTPRTCECYRIRDNTLAKNSWVQSYVRDFDLPQIWMSSLGTFLISSAWKWNTKLIFHARIQHVYILMWLVR